MAGPRAARGCTREPATRRWTALSFDLDGTLVDTAAEIATAANRATAEFGFTAQSVAAITPLIGAGGHELVRRLLARLAVHTPAAAAVPLEQVAARFKQHYAAVAGSSAMPYPGCAETLQRLRGRRAPGLRHQQGPARSPADPAGDRARRLLRAAARRRQPAAEEARREVLDHALQVLGGDRRGFAHIGDSATDIAAARNAEVAAWAVPWGYNGGEPVAAARPDRLFDSLPEIADHVLAENAAR